MRNQRKPISKKIREQVFNKFNGHCAYCGCELKMETMQVDHLEPLYPFWYRKEERDLNVIENYMPACRQCNFYKGAMSLEHFRSELKTLMDRVKKPFIYRLADKYGMVSESKWDGRFYFEKNEHKI